MGRYRRSSKQDGRNEHRCDRFSLGKRSFLSVGPAKGLRDSVLSINQAGEDASRQVFGDSALRSDYSFHDAILETTAEQITPFVPKKEAVNRAMLLLLKATSIPRPGESGIFNIAAGEFRGFQFGKPEVSPGRVNVERYSDSGSIRFIFGQKKDGPVTISQRDINRIVQTVHRVN